MTGHAAERSATNRPAGLLRRLVSIAEEPTDDDDARLRRRVGVVAGLLTVFAPWPLPIQAEIHPAAWVLAAGMSLYTLLNLAVLARTGNFERYVSALLISGVVFVPLATAVGGGITGTSSGLAFGFLVPAYALMALGPSRATRWFIVFLAMAVGMVVADPFARGLVDAPPYILQLSGQAMNTLIPLTIVFLLLRYIDLRRRAAEARVDELLSNAIPASIAARLKRGEHRIAETYPETTVVFADIVGFTPWAQSAGPARVVSLLDELFTRFDELAAAHGVEKIKTIGDSYMAAAGAPNARPDHAAAALAFGKAMLQAVAQWRRINDLPLDLRVGLASGSVVAGVIGEQRILFDLWGDTVNVAARMESSGVPGRIQIAESTWQRLPDQSAFSRREADVKGLGRMTTYLPVEGSVA